MGRAKQTVCITSSASRLVGMQAARFGERAEEEQFVDVPNDDEVEGGWLDLDAPPQGAEAGEPRLV